ncbi:MAG: hypothetical protein IPK79_07275 [Vampirovibrionales bacterium]|nr:hypothetical protein [Vampirovibrionales bacterium]
MNELEMALTLGILPEPTKNRVHVDAFMQLEISFLSEIFKISRLQKEDIGSPNGELWSELLPWHSMN